MPSRSDIPDPAILPVIKDSIREKVPEPEPPDGRPDRALSTRSPAPERAVRRTERKVREHETGSLLDLHHGVRAMKVYPFTEPDVRSLMSMSLMASFAFSLGGAFIGYGINVEVSASFYTELAAEAKTMVHIVAPLCFVVGTAFILGGFVAEFIRWRTWDGVKKSTRSQGLSAGSV